MDWIWILIHWNVDCQMGEDCQYWRKGYHCAYPGILEIGDKGARCMKFKPDYASRRQDLHTQMNRRR